MSGTSSAVPANLETFVTDAGNATGRLATGLSQATSTIEAFLQAPCDSRFRVGGDGAAVGQVRQLVTDNQTDERWIDGIRQAFVAAGATQLSNPAIANALHDAGISATAPGAITADEPVYQGATMYSGWSDDPVSTATGHFLEIEADLVMPDRLRTLQWTRTHSSRFVRHEGIGRGWYSWASTRLEIGADQVIYAGPDGQTAPFVRAGDGFLRHPAMEAELDTAGDGFVLRWRWGGRFPGMHWHFDAGGRLWRIDDPFGATTAVSHDDDGRLVGLAHEGGRHLRIDWDGSQIVQVTSSDGRRVSYRYDGDDLVGVDRPAGEQRLAVDRGGRILELHDADGVRLVRNTYDDDGRVLSQESPFGRLTRYRYLAPSTLVVGDDDGGPTTLFRHDHAGRLVEMQLADGTRSTRRFDEHGNPVEISGFDGGTTRRTFDQTGNCVVEVDPAGGVIERTFDAAGRLVRVTDPSGRWTEYRYDGDGALPTLIREPLGAETRFELVDGMITAATDSDGVRVGFGRDADGLAVATTDGEGAVTRFRHAPDGSVIEQVSASGAREAREVDGAGRLLARISHAGDRWELTRSPAGRVVASRDFLGATVQARYGPHGQLVSVTDPSGAETTVEWDGLGRATAMHTPGGGQWAYDFDDVGRLRGVTDPTGAVWPVGWSEQGWSSGFGDPLGRRAESTFDAMGRQTAVTTPGGPSLALTWDPAGRFLGGVCAEQDSSCQIVRDESGRPVEARVDGRAVSRCTYTPAGRLETLSRPDGTMWQWHYDRAGRPVRTDGPTGSIRVGYDADGNVTEATSAGGSMVRQEWGSDGRLAARHDGGIRTEYRFDAIGRLVEERSGDAHTGYTYDQRGLLTAVTDRLGAVTRFDHDERGVVTAVTGPDGGRWVTERDACGRPTATVDPLGRRSAMTLDAAGRVVEQTTPDGARRTYRWSAADDIEAVTVDGRLMLAVERDTSGRRVGLRNMAGQALQLDFDGLGRITEVDRAGALTTWSYDDDARTIVTTQDGRRTVTTVDADDRPVALATEGLAPLRIERDGDGRVTAVTADGFARLWARNAAGAVVRYEERTGATVTHVDMDYDNHGRLISVVGDGEQRYAYDAAGQLVVADGPDGTWTWAYDERGRLTDERGPDGHRRFRYDAADQLVAVHSDTGTRIIDHDARGRRIAERDGDDDASTVRYRWDDGDRLVAVDGPGSASLAVDYDPLGLPRAIGAQAVAWCDGPLGPALSGIGETQVVGLPGMPLAAGPAGDVRWLRADWQGSVGGPTVWGGPASPGRPEGAGLGFLGELQADDLVWMRHRVYDPSTHAFLSRDPLPGDLGWPGSPTAGYLYAHNSPLQWFDPLGLKPVTADEAAAQMQAWRQGHMKELLVTAAAVVVIVGVGVLTCGVGDVALASFAAPVLIGGGLSGATTAVSSYVRTGHVDWGEVVMNTAVGGAVGAFAPVIPAPMSLASRVGLGAAYGGVGASGSTALDEYATGQGFHPIDDLESGGIGAVTGGVLHGAHWTEELRPNQLRNFNKYLATSKQSPDANDPTTWSRQWQNRMGRLDPAASGKTASRANVAAGVTPPAIGVAVAPAPEAGVTPNPLNAPHAAVRAWVPPPGFIGPVAGP